MKINKKEPISGLKKVISRLFNVKLDNFSFEKYPPKLPISLKELYEIDAFYAKHDCAFETIRFFCNQDRLVPYADLKLGEKDFVFVRENQNNWVCKTELGSNKVYFEDRVFTETSGVLPQEIDAFLTTFALQEIGFNLKHYFGLEAKSMVEIESVFNKVEHLWTSKYLTYDDPFSYYLIDDDCLVVWAGMAIFSTNNEEKFTHYKSLLAHYTF